MVVITTNASTFTDQRRSDLTNTGSIFSSVVAATNNTTSVSISSNTQIDPFISGMTELAYLSQLFYNNLDTTNILPISASFAPGSNTQIVTASQLNAMTGTPNAGKFYLNKTLVFLYYSNQIYRDIGNNRLPLPNAFITPAPPGASLNSYGGIQIATETFTVQPCNPPTLLTATNLGFFQVLLSWTAPDDGGSPIIDYLVQYRITSGPGAWVNFIHTPSPSPSITVNELAENVTYDFRVAGINGFCGGVGPVSGPFSNIATTTVLTTLPTRPTNLVAIALDGGAVNLSWTASTVTPVTTITYLIQYKIGRFGDWMDLTRTTATFYNIPNFNSIAIVNNSVTYCFQVYATITTTTPTPTTNKSAPSNIASAMPFDNSLVPSREWSRFDPNCSGVKIAMNAVEDTSYEMLRKANVLQNPEVGILRFTKAIRWAMAARNQLTRKKGWASQSDTYTYPNTSNINGEPFIGLRQVGNTLTCWVPPSPVICNSSTSSNVPGKPVILCFAADAPFNNYRRPITYSAGGTKWPIFFSKRQ
jgi:hypothetical protein